jgi:hypothetical protein
MACESSTKGQINRSHNQNKTIKKDGTKLRYESESGLRKNNSTFKKFLISKNRSESISKPSRTLSKLSKSNHLKNRNGRISMNL